LQAITEIFRVLKPGGKLIVTLSTGRSDGIPSTWLERYQAILDEQIIPGMQEMGFAQAYLEQGPDSRQFKTVAVVGEK
jgi:ubiquinone/menaquinone biosynthesis C-methylase UbiE